MAARTEDFHEGGRRAIKDHLKCLLKFFSSLFVVLICQEGLPICLRAHKSAMNMFTLGSFFSFGYCLCNYKFKNT